MSTACEDAPLTAVGMLCCKVHRVFEGGVTCWPALLLVPRRIEDGGIHRRSGRLDFISRLVAPVLLPGPSPRHVTRSSTSSTLPSFTLIARTLHFGPPAPATALVRRRPWLTHGCSLLTDVMPCAQAFRWPRFWPEEGYHQRCTALHARDTCCN